MSILTCVSRVTTESPREPKVYMRKDRGNTSLMGTVKSLTRNGQRGGHIHYHWSTISVEIHVTFSTTYGITFTKGISGLIDRTVFDVQVSTLYVQDIDLNKFYYRSFRVPVVVT